MLDGKIDALLGWLSSAGLRRGLSGDGWPWLGIALAAVVWRRARRQSEETLEVFGIRPGDRLEIVAVGRPGRRERRGQRRKGLYGTPIVGERS